MRMQITCSREPNLFREEVERRLSYNLSKCLQCSKCGGACVNSDNFDLTPRQVIESTLDGLRDKVFNSRSIWMCGQCQDCQIECPAGIEISEVMKIMRDLALENNVTPNAEPYDREYIKEFYCPKADGLVEENRDSEQ